MIYDDHSFFSGQRAWGQRCQSIPAILPHLQQLSKWLTPVHTHTYTCTHTQTHLPHCQSKLGACSLNPIYGSPIVFLDAVSDTGKKGQNSSSHHPDRERETEKKYICIWKWERERERERQRWTDRTKKTERLKQTGRHKKRDRWVERQWGREEVRQTHRQTEG